MVQLVYRGRQLASLSAPRTVITITVTITTTVTITVTITITITRWPSIASSASRSSLFPTTRSRTLARSRIWWSEAYKRGRIKRGCSQKPDLQIGGKTGPRHIQNTGLGFGIQNSEFWSWRDKAALLIRPGLIRPGLCSPNVWVMYTRFILFICVYVCVYVYVSLVQYH